MKKVDAIKLAIADHKATNQGQQDFEFTDALRRIITLLELLADIKE